MGFNIFRKVSERSATTVQKAARYKSPAKQLKRLAAGGLYVFQNKDITYPLTWDVPSEVDFKQGKIVLYAGRIHPEKG